MSDCPLPSPKSMPSSKKVFFHEAIVPCTVPTNTGAANVVPKEKPTVFRRYASESAGFSRGLSAMAGLSVVAGGIVAGGIVAGGTAEGSSLAVCDCLTVIVFSSVFPSS